VPKRTLDWEGLERDLHAAGVSAAEIEAGAQQLLARGPRRGLRRQNHAPACHRHRACRRLAKRGRRGSSGNCAAEASAVRAAARTWTLMDKINSKPGRPDVGCALGQASHWPWRPAYTRLEVVRWMMVLPTGSSI
jgi:hypothetical protein